ncbi:PTS lactose/cellobiose transporter subunit IIA [Amedibacillus sp. YH-ame6]
MELLCFQLISAAGSARSFYIEALQEAKVGHIDEMNQCIQQGDEAFLEGHKVHGELIAKEANGEACQVSLLLVHAEDQLMSAESFKILILELIELHNKQ